MLRLSVNGDVNHRSTLIDAILLQPVAVRNTLPIQIDIKRSGEYQGQVKSHGSSASATFGRQR